MMQLQAQPAAIDRQLSDVVSRLLRAIEEENHMLAERQGQSLDALIQKKSQLLLELLRVQKTVSPETLQPPAGSCSRTLREPLRPTSACSPSTLPPPRKSPTRSSRRLRQSESDGTYGSAFGGYDSAPDDQDAVVGLWAGGVALGGAYLAMMLGNAEGQATADSGNEDGRSSNSSTPAA